MKAREFGEWLTGLSRLSRGQRAALAQRLSRPVQRREIAAWLEEGMAKACPACGADRPLRDIHPPCLQLQQNLTPALCRFPHTVLSFSCNNKSTRYAALFQLLKQQIRL